MKKTLQEIVKDIEQKLSTINYGFKKTLATNVDKSDLTVTIKGLGESEEYDCLYYNLKGKELLENNNIKTTVVQGQDESGFWKNHVYLMTDKGEVIDFTPVYDTLGMKHGVGTQLRDSDIQRYMQNHKLSIANLLPLHFNPESRSLLRISAKLTKIIGPVKIRKPHIEIYLDLLQYNNDSKKYEKKEELSLYHTGKEIESHMDSLKSLINNNVLQIGKEKIESSEIIKIESDIDKYVMNFLRKIL